MVIGTSQALHLRLFIFRVPCASDLGFKRVKKFILTSQSSLQSKFVTVQAGYGPSSFSPPGPQSPLIKTPPLVFFITCPPFSVLYHVSSIFPLPPTAFFQRPVINIYAIHAIRMPAHARLMLSS